MADCNITEINLCRKRGDTFAITFTIKDQDGNAIDITGFSFLLTVDPSPNPSDALGNLFQLTGTIVNATGGQVRFGPLSTAQADQAPSVYFYDVQQTDGAGDIRTIVTGQWEVVQDITK